MANNAVISERVQNTTNQFIFPKMVDTVLNSNVLTQRLLSKGKKWSGERMQFPVKVAKNTTGGSFAGLDTFSVQAQNNSKKLEFFPSFVQKTTAIPLTDVSANKTDEGVLNLLELQMTSDAQDLADDIGTMFYGDGTGNSNKDFLGLAAIVDDGTTASTYGGLSRSTYTSLKSTVDSSSSTLSISKMYSLLNGAKSGSQKPTLGICDESVFALYASLLTPQEQIVKDVGMMKNGLIGGTGFVGLNFAGIPIIADEKATSGVLFFINEDFLDFYGLPMANTKPISLSNSEIVGNDYSGSYGFTTSGLLTPIDQAAIVANMYVGGQLVSSNPKRHAKATGLTSV